MWSSAARDARTHPRRVLFLTVHCPQPNEPGAVRPWLEACQLSDLNCGVTVITSAIQYMTGADLRRGQRGWCCEEWCDGIRFLRVYGLRSYRQSVWRRTLQYGLFAMLGFCAALIHARPRPDVILVGTDPITISPVSWFLSILFRARLVLDERDLYPETAIALGVLKPGWISHGLSSFQQWLRRRAAFILCATPGIRNYLIQQGVPDRKLGLLYNADPELLHTDEMPSLETLQSRLRERAPPGSQFWVIYAGGMGRAGDLDTLLEAARILGPDTGIGFILVGDGERASDYRSRATSGRLPISFTGPLPRREARQLIRGAHVGVLLFPGASLFQVALPSKIFDYLGLGCPVVFLGSGDTAEVLRESGAGIQIPSGDAPELARALQDLSRDPGKCRTMGASGRDWFARHATGPKARAVLMHAVQMEQLQ